MARCQTHFWTFNFFREEYLDSRQKRDREREIWRVDSRNRRRFGRGNSFLNGKTIPPRGATKQLGIVMSSIWRRGGWLSLPLLVLSKIVVENNARLFIRFFFRWMAIWWKSNWSDLESAKGKWKGVRRGGEGRGSILYLGIGRRTWHNCERGNNYPSWLLGRVS